MIIRVRDAIMVGIFGSTGSGKGTSFLIPNLLARRASVFVLDPQGSLFDATARHRERRFLHRVVRLDSSGICGPSSDGLNPLDFIDAQSPDCLDQCGDLASLLVVRTGQEHDPYWSDAAERVLKVFIYYIAAAETDPERHNLLSVRAIVSSRDTYLACLNVMQQMGGLLAQQAGTLSWLADKELNSVLSSVQRHTAWMDSPTVAASLKTSTFHPLDLRKGRTDVYVIQSPDRLVTMAAHLRVILGTTLRVLTRGKASEKNPVWFFIDETAALGRMQILEDAITTMRGFGIRLALIFQSPGQLQKVYGENAQTVLDNLKTQMYFAMRSPESGEHISKMIGDATIDIETASEQESTSQPTGTSSGPSPGSKSRSTTRNFSQVSRRWLKPEETRTLAPDLALAFHGELHVIPVKLLRYYDSPAFRSLLPGRYRTGDSRGLGLAGITAASVCLLAALVFSSVVGRFLAFDTERRRQDAAAVRPAGDGLPYGPPAYGRHRR